MSEPETQWEIYDGENGWLQLSGVSLASLLLGEGHQFDAVERWFALGAEVYYSPELWFRPVRAERLDST